MSSLFLPKGKTFETLFKSYHDKLAEENTPKLKIEKMRQLYTNRISQKIEKKLEDVETKDKVDNKDVKDEETRQRLQTVLGPSERRVELKDKVDNKDVKDEEMTTTWGSSWPLEEDGAQGQGRQ